MRSINDTHESRRAREKKKKKYQLRKLKNLGLAVIPFVIFLIGLTLMSIGVIRYVERESIVSVFLTSRDQVRTRPLHGVDLTGQTEVIVETEKKQVTKTEDRRLVVPFYYVGDQAGVVRIKSADIDVKVFQGTSESQFRLGAGHHQMSFWPGQDGNIVLATHRTTYFRNFEYVKIGDTVEFETTYGMFTYRVKDLKIVDGTDHYIIGKTDQEQLTMYTCYPFTYIGNAPNRYVVISELVDMELY